MAVSNVVVDVTANLSLLRGVMPSGWPCRCLHACPRTGLHPCPCAGAVPGAGADAVGPAGFWLLQMSTNPLGFSKYLQISSSHPRTGAVLGAGADVVRVAP